MGVTEQAKQEQLQRLKQDLDTSLLWRLMDEWLQECLSMATRHMLRADTPEEMWRAQGEYAALERVLRAPRGEIAQGIQAVETTNG